MVQTIVGNIIFCRYHSDHDDHAHVGDVGKSLAFCTAPDRMMREKKRTRKSDKGKGEDRSEQM